MLLGAFLFVAGVVVGHTATRISTYREWQLNEAYLRRAVDLARNAIGRAPLPQDEYAFAPVVLKDVREAIEDLSLKARFNVSQASDLEQACHRARQDEYRKLASRILGDMLGVVNTTFGHRSSHYRKVTLKDQELNAGVTLRTGWYEFPNRVLRAYEAVVNELKHEQDRTNALQTQLAAQQLNTHMRREDTSPV